MLVTQNIDNLHRRAGSKAVYPMHGELLKARCIETGELFDWENDLFATTAHPKKPGRQKGLLRPHVVWLVKCLCTWRRFITRSANAICLLRLEHQGTFILQPGLSVRLGTIAGALN